MRTAYFILHGYSEGYREVHNHKYLAVIIISTILVWSQCRPINTSDYSSYIKNIPNLLQEIAIHPIVPPGHAVLGLQLLVHAVVQVVI